MTITELKAKAYDAIEQIGKWNAELQRINVEIAKATMPKEEKGP